MLSSPVAIHVGNSTSHPGLRRPQSRKKVRSTSTAAMSIPKVRTFSTSSALACGPWVAIPPTVLPPIHMTLSTM